MTISTRTLTRTLWQRLQLVPGHRTTTGVSATVEHVIGLQAQDNLPPYLSLAARVDGFVPADLSDLLESRALVRMLTMRGTVHVLSGDDALALRPWVQPALDRIGASNQTSRPAAHVPTERLDAVLRDFLGDEARPLAAIGARLVEEFPDVPEVALKHVVRERLPLLQAPPRGLWKRSGGVSYAYVDRYLGRDLAEPDVETLVLRYLAAYGPATAADMTTWSTVTRLGPVFTAMARSGRLGTVTDERGRTLFDAAGAELADEDLSLPVTLLGKYDNVFLSHADRDRITPDAVRTRWMGANGGVAATLFVDGLLAGLWRVEGDRVVVEPFATLTKAQRSELDAEITRVETLLSS
ncbi:MAG: winged helix DNA-binding domain-containing protein [Marmoricola sp.]